MSSAAHQEAQILSAAAALAMEEGRIAEARTKYAEAAVFEERALRDVAPDKVRTRGILAVSHASILFKSGQIDATERACFRYLGPADLPASAEHHLRTLLRMVDEYRAYDASRVITTHTLTAAVSGGLVGDESLPLENAIELKRGLLSLLWRLVEMCQGRAFRTAAAVPPEVRESFQIRVAGGSGSRVSLTLHDAVQPGLECAPREVAGRVVDAFFGLADAVANEDATAVEDLATDARYRGAGLRLIRNVVPIESGAYTRLDLSRSAPSGVTRVSLGAGARSAVGRLLSPDEARAGVAPTATVVTGILRGLHLDKRWIEVRTDERVEHLTVDPERVLDEVIGPMVNRRVVARGYRRGRSVRFVDVELAT
jgi:hypothetical protein